VVKEILVTPIVYLNKKKIINNTLWFAINNNEIHAELANSLLQHYEYPKTAYNVGSYVRSEMKNKIHNLVISIEIVYLRHCD